MAAFKRLCRLMPYALKAKVAVSTEAGGDYSRFGYKTRDRGYGGYLRLFTIGGVSGLSATRKPYPMWLKFQVFFGNF